MFHLESGARVFKMVGGGKLFGKHKLVRRDTSHVGATSIAINISTFGKRRLLWVEKRRACKSGVGKIEYSATYWCLKTMEQNSLVLFGTFGLENSCPTSIFLCFRSSEEL